MPPTKKRLGMRIKETRQARGLTQETLAKKAGIHPVYLAQIEGSAKNPPTRTPSLPMLQRLAKALKVKVGELLE
jgi:transcriptional regulator with XRE-family HTH domain